LKSSRPTIIALRSNTVASTVLGYNQDVDISERYRVKRIVVTLGSKLSLQKHFHRSEHWVVVKGTAEVTVGDDICILYENESIYIRSAACIDSPIPAKFRSN